MSGRLGARQRLALTALLDDVPLVETDRAHWYRVGRLRASLAARGSTMSTPDAHVAQCTMDVGAELLTEDAIFRRVARHTGLRLVGG